MGNKPVTFPFEIFGGLLKDAVKKTKKRQKKTRDVGKKSK